MRPNTGSLGQDVRINSTSYLTIKQQWGLCAEIQGGSWSTNDKYIYISTFAQTSSHAIADHILPPFFTARVTLRKDTLSSK